MMHPDFIKDDHRFSDRETTDREDYLLFNEENVMKEPKMITKELYVHASGYKDEVDVYNCDMSEYGSAFLGKVSVTFVVPDKDPIEAKVEALNKKLSNLQAETYKKSEQIKEEIQSLLAIGHYTEPLSDDYPF